MREKRAAQFFTLCNLFECMNNAHNNLRYDVEFFNRPLIFKYQVHTNRNENIEMIFKLKAYYLKSNRREIELDSSVCLFINWRTTITSNR